jgi:hypothetical protein
VLHQLPRHLPGHRRHRGHRFGGGGDGGAEGAPPGGEGEREEGAAAGGLGSDERRDRETRKRAAGERADGEAEAEEEHYLWGRMAAAGFPPPHDSESRVVWIELAMAVFNLCR